MNRNLITQLERVVLLFVLYALAGVAGSAVAYRLLGLGRSGPDYGPLVVSIGLLVVLVGCIVSVRGRENAPLFPLPPWVPGPGATLLILGMLPVVAVLFRNGAAGTGAAVATTAPVHDTIVSILPQAPVSSPQPDTVAAPLTGTPAVEASGPVTAPSTAAITPRRSFIPSAYEPDQAPTAYNPAARFPVPTRYASPSTVTASDVSWAERLRRRVLRDNYQPSTAEMGRYRRVRDSVQRTTGNLSLGSATGPLAAPPATTTTRPRTDPFEEVPTDIPAAGEPVRGSFSSGGSDTTAP